jgi:DNA-binding transcriptional LysR family regulator
VTISATGVSPLLPPELGETLSWDDVRLALAVIETGSACRASQALGVSKPTIMRRLGRLEESLGTRLFERTPSGLRPTYEGQRLLQEAAAARAIFARTLKRRELSKQIDGTCRIVLGDGIATYWLPRFLPAFRAQHPRIDVQLVGQRDNFKTEPGDLHIHYFEPANTELHSCRLGTLHLLPFASKAYAALHELPKTAQELGAHCLLEQEHYLLDKGSLAALTADLGAPLTRSYTNMSACLVESIRVGLGIGLLPTYLAAIADEFIALDLGLSYSLPIWISYSQEAVAANHVRQALDFLKRAVFDHKRMPWFAGDLLMPIAEWREAERSRFQVAQATKNTPLARVFVAS